MSEQAGRVAALAQAGTVAAACQAVVDHLLGQGLPLPSIYLERGGRLRCQAVRGYWQVFDGIPVDAGVIGATFRRGNASEVRGVTGSRDYLAAAPSVTDEVCVPLIVSGRVVGVINVESTTGLPGEALSMATDAATQLSDRIAELGGVPEESPAQRLVRHSALITSAVDVMGLWSAGCAAAAEVTGSSSAALVVSDAHGKYSIAHADGPITSRLAVAASAEALAAVAQWVSSGSSCWTVDDPDGCGFPGSETLRAAGAAAALVVPLPGDGAELSYGGYLLVVDEIQHEPATDVVELLELLGLHLFSCARTLASVAALRHRASRDPLTDLGHHAAYQEALTAALDDGLAERQVAVILVDVDNFKQVNDSGGHPAGDRLLRNTARVLSAVLRDGEDLFRIGGDEFATVLRVTTPVEAAEIAARLHDAARSHLAVTISVGVALAEPGEPPASLLARADTALYTVKRDGRDGVHLAKAAPQHARDLRRTGVSWPRCDLIDRRSDPPATR